MTLMRMELVRLLCMSREEPRRGPLDNHVDRPAGVQEVVQIRQ